MNIASRNPYCWRGSAGEKIERERERSIVCSTMLQWSTADTCILSVYLSIWAPLSRSPSTVRSLSRTCDDNAPVSCIEPFTYRKYRDWKSRTGSIEAHNQIYSTRKTSHTHKFSARHIFSRFTPSKAIWNQRNCQLLIWIKKQTIRSKITLKNYTKPFIT